MSAGGARGIATDVEVPVLVVGAGGSGLVAALCLADLGIDALLVERHSSTSQQPRAHLLNPRTMEIFAQHGLADDIYDEGVPIEHCGAMVWMTSLGGDGPTDRRVLHRAPAYGGSGLRAASERASAYRHGNLGQLWLEPLILRHLERRPTGRRLFRHELVGVDLEDDRVTATVVDREHSTTLNVRARYMIAADGGKTVGGAIGVQMLGTPTLLDWITLHVSADFSEFLPYDDAVVNRITSLSAAGELEHCGVVPMGPTRWGRHSEQWTIMFCVPPGARHDDAVTVVAKVRGILKLPDRCDMKVHSISHWPVEGRVADRFRVGPVFLVGDAAHRHPPSGALGLNTGIQDAHNLAWKLAAVLHGQAPERLLDRYEAERRPVSERVVERAMFALFNQIAMTSAVGVMAGASPEWNRTQLEALLSDSVDGQVRRLLLDEYFRTNRITTAHLGMELGYDYAQAGFVAEADCDGPPRDPLGVEYTQTSLPGHRLPHAWLQRGDRRVATHQLVTAGRFLLLAGSSGSAWLDAAEALSDASGVPIAAYAVGPAGELGDHDGVWGSLRGHDEHGAILVRPDGFVAQRHSGVEADPAEVLEHSLRIALGQAPARAGQAV
jgi:2,4-dichlorophenol 6-monooxygenase